METERILAWYVIKFPCSKLDSLKTFNNVTASSMAQ